MAEVHVVSIGYVKVRTGGGVVQKQSTISENLSFDREFRVLENSNVPNSVGSPTLETYLSLEAAAGFIPNHISQSLVVTLKT